MHASRGISGMHSTVPDNSKRHRQLVIQTDPAFGHLMRVSTYRSLRCRLGRLTEAHVKPGRPMLAAAAMGCRGSSSFRHEARPARLIETCTSRGRRFSPAISAATTSPQQCAPCWHRGPEIPAAVAPRTTHPSTSRAPTCLSRQEI